MDDVKDEIEFESEEDADFDWESSDDGTRHGLGPDDVHTREGKPSIGFLHKMFQNKKLVLQDEFQRYYVWGDRKKPSKLIESVLLRIPIPIIYFSVEKDGKWYVIDGQQRLTAFFNYVDGRFSLFQLEKMSDLNGLKFSKLDEEHQSTILKCGLRIIVFKPESDENLKFEIFERLNTGAVALSQQELRNCIYRGRYNDALKDMAKDDDFKDLTGFGKKEEKHMKDVEAVLRFAAFFHQGYINYKSPMKAFLNREMEKNRDLDDSGELRDAFEQALDNVDLLCGDERAFRRFCAGKRDNPNGGWEKKINLSLYDILMHTMANTVDRSQCEKYRDSIREALIDLMAFGDPWESSGNTDSVKKLFELWQGALVDIDRGGESPCRFSLALKRDLFNSYPTCAFCGQSIQLMDDAALAHIDQYWLGAIPDDARLAHRYCVNLERARRIAEAGSRVVG